MINTKKVSGRRVVSLPTLEAAIAEAERLCAIEHAGKLVRLGNWTLGQTLGYLAAWINYAYDGYPFKPPMLMRRLGPMLKGIMLGEREFPKGMRLSGAEAGTYGIDPFTTEEGLARFRLAIDRLRKSAPSGPNPLFGKLNAEQWHRMHLKHAELHMSFLRG